jgi:hypothetical protein
MGDTSGGRILSSRSDSCRTDGWRPVLGQANPGSILASGVVEASLLGRDR